MSLKEQILNLRSQGFTYPQIEEKLKCSRGTISYHCGKGQKEKTKERSRRNRQNQHPFVRKIEFFKKKYIKPKTKKQLHKWKKLIQLKIETFFYNRENNMQYQKPEFTVEDVIKKFGEHPKCYLTGEPIDIYKPRTYHFDHKIPVSKGGNNSLENLGICTKEANQAKHDMTPEEFVAFCRRVVAYSEDRVGLEPTT